MRGLNCIEPIAKINVFLQIKKCILDKNNEKTSPMPALIMQK